MKLHFQKYEALGNDFIVAEAQRPDLLSVEQAIRLCDRHFGLGADGVLLVTPPGSPGARARMTVINADGSQPEMCGNGLRCVALHLARTAGETEISFGVDTDAGLLSCAVERDEHRASVRTTMGQGRHDGVIDHPMRGKSVSFVRISMGNPHAVYFGPQLSPEELDQVGSELSARLEGGSNVEIATHEPDGSLRLSVWERGVGRTLACGTGAAATAVAAVLAGTIPSSRPTTIHLPGGDLVITVHEGLEVEMCGPARWVYSGTTLL